MKSNPTKRYYIAALLWFLAIQTLYAQTPEWKWAKSAGYQANAIKTDAAGNSYVTGSFSGTVTFDTITLTHIGGADADIFVAKYDASGNVLWAKKAGGDYDDSGYGISVDAAGNSYVTGSFYSPSIFGNITISASLGGRADIFVAKYDASGNVLWAKKAGGFSITSSGNGGKGISVDAAGNSYVTGYFQGTATFGTITLASSGDRDIFVAKYDASGNVLWAKKAGGNSTYADAGNGISVDTEGNSYVTGYFQGTATFGTITLASSGDRDIFVAKYDASGNVLWAKKAVGSNSYGIGSGISLDAAGNSYVTGYFRGTATFGTITLASSGDDDIFVSKYDASGNVLWAKKAGGTSSDNGNGISVDAAGNSYVTGEFSGTVTFGTMTLTSSGVDDIFIAKYDASGNVLWAKKVGDFNHDRGNGISVDAAGSAYIVGKGYITLFTNDPIQGSGFIAKLNPCGAPQIPIISVSSVLCAATLSVQSPQTGVSYLWSNGVTGHSINVNSAGDFSVRAISNGCTSAVSAVQSISVKQSSSSTINAAICQGGSYQFGNKNLTTVGIYTATYTNAVGCDSIVTLNLTQEIFAPNFPNNTLLKQGSSVQLSASGGSSYQWSPAYGLSATNIPNPIASPEVTTTYTLTITHALGCSQTYEVIVTVTESGFLNEVFVPNSFSPNNDGKNDELRVFGNNLATYELLIFNRLGNEVAQINNTSALTWDGQYKGQLLTGETLLWTLKGQYKDGQNFSNKGSVVVLK